MTRSVMVRARATQPLAAPRPALTSRHARPLLTPRFPTAALIRYRRSTRVAGRRLQRGRQELRPRPDIAARPLRADEAAAHALLRHQPVGAHAPRGPRGGHRDAAAHRHQRINVLVEWVAEAAPEYENMQTMARPDLRTTLESDGYVQRQRSRKRPRPRPTLRPQPHTHACYRYLQMLAATRFASAASAYLTHGLVAILAYPPPPPPHCFLRARPRPRPR